MTREIISRNGTITSPNYPNNYPNRANCAWKITVPLGFRVQLTFDSFRLESNSRCRYDSVQLHNGPSDLSPLIGKYCGAIKPPVASSDGRSMYVRFRSDGSGSYKGFRASFAAVPSTTTKPSGMILVYFLDLITL